MIDNASGYQEFVQKNHCKYSVSAEKYMGMDIVTFEGGRSRKGSQWCLWSVKEHLSKAVRRAIVIHHPVVVVNALKVGHNAKGEIMCNITGCVHPFHNRPMEVDGLLVGALCSAIEILAGVFCYPKVEPEGAMEIFHVGYEFVRADIVPVDAEPVERTAVPTRLDELLYPSLP